MRVKGQKSKMFSYTGLGLGRIRPETRRGHILLCVTLWSAIMFLVVQNFVVSSVVVEGKSMMPTLKPGDCRFVNCWLPRLRGYRRGDVVMIRDVGRNDYMVKRIIGLPHDHVQLRNGKVFVNGQLLRESYLDAGTGTYSQQLPNHAIRVGSESYFVMGDNRAESEDSRFFGDIDRADLIGLVSH